MIIIDSDNYAPYSSQFLPTIYKNIIPSNISSFIFNNKYTKCILATLYSISGKCFTEKIDCDGIMVLVFVKKDILIINQERVVCDKGDYIFIEHEYRTANKIITPSSCLTFYELKFTNKIFDTIENRLIYRDYIKMSLLDISKKPDWEQCDDILKKDIIGKGSFGNVYTSIINNMLFATKFTKLDKELLNYPVYNNYFYNWHEIYIFKNILNPILEKGICPNVPLLYDSLTCREAKINIKNKDITTPCLITNIELSSSTLRKFILSNPSIDELYSALFQCMAGIHAYQKYGQIMNFDMKKDNVLMYNLSINGYWEYIIRGKSYYVPTYNKLFVINDFGLSRSVSPQHILYKNPTSKQYRLGKRYCIIVNNILTPIKVEKSSTKIALYNEKTSRNFNVPDEFIYKNDQIEPRVDISYYKSLGIVTDSSNPKFFEQPEIIPPFEFFNDTQDCIRMFIGGKRTTQEGDHTLIKTIPNLLIQQLTPYISKSKTLKDFKFCVNPNQLLASYFIESFFYFYRNKPYGPVLSTFKIS